MRAHRGRGRPHQKAHVAPVDFQVVELQNRAGREETRRDTSASSSIAGSGTRRLNAPLQLQQLDLKIGGGREIRLLFLQAPKLDDFSGFRPAAAELQSRPDCTGPRLLCYGEIRFLTSLSAAKHCGGLATATAMHCRHGKLRVLGAATALDRLMAKKRPAAPRFPTAVPTAARPKSLRNRHAARATSADSRRAGEPKETAAPPTARASKGGPRRRPRLPVRAALGEGRALSTS